MAGIDTEKKWVGLFQFFASERHGSTFTFVNMTVCFSFDTTWNYGRGILVYSKGQNPVKTVHSSYVSLSNATQILILAPIVILTATK